MWIALGKNRVHSCQRIFQSRKFLSQPRFFCLGLGLCSLGNSGESGKGGIFRTPAIPTACDLISYPNSSRKIPVAVARRSLAVSPHIRIGGFSPRFRSSASKALHNTPAGFPCLCKSLTHHCCVVFCESPYAFHSLRPGLHERHREGGLAPSGQR